MLHIAEFFVKKLDSFTDSVLYCKQIREGGDRLCRRPAEETVI